MPITTGVKGVEGFIAVVTDPCLSAKILSTAEGNGSDSAKVAWEDSIVVSVQVLGAVTDKNVRHGGNKSDMIRLMMSVGSCRSFLISLV